jgi:hypothetical protein
MIAFSPLKNHREGLPEDDFAITSCGGVTLCLAVAEVTRVRAGA